MSNFSFLIRCSFLQLIIVSFPSFTILAFALIIGLEFFYLGTNVIHYTRNRHLKSFLYMIPKVLQSLILLITEFLFLLSFTRLDYPYFGLSEATQKSLIKIILVGTFAEYAFLVINVIAMVLTMLEERKLKKLDPKYKAFVEVRE